MATNNPNALPKGFILNSPTGTYRILEILGSGGFGITYLANTKIRFGNFSQTVTCAIKEHFLSDMCGRANNSQMVYSDPVRTTVEDSMKDFIAEAQRLQQVGANHPNIVKVNEVFRANGTAYYVMEYLNGRSLRKYIEANGPLSQAELFRILCPIMEAVDFLHSERVTHLDIKPDNIMLTTEEDDAGNQHMRPVLIDFGLSKHYDEGGRPTSTLKTLGCSDGYSPIEQYAGITTFSPAADIYALAATCLYCLTGHDPAKSTELFLQDLPTQIGALNLSPGFADTLLAALSPGAASRPTSLLATDNYYNTPEPAPQPAPDSRTHIIDPEYYNPSYIPNPAPNPAPPVPPTPPAPPSPPRPYKPVSSKPRRNLIAIFGAVFGVILIAVVSVIIVQYNKSHTTAEFIAEDVDTLDVSVDPMYEHVIDSAASPVSNEVPTQTKPEPAKPASSNAANQTAKYQSGDKHNYDKPHHSGERPEAAPGDNCAKKGASASASKPDPDPASKPDYGKVSASNDSKPDQAAAARTTRRVKVKINLNQTLKYYKMSESDFKKLNPNVDARELRRGDLITVYAK